MKSAIGPFPQFIWSILTVALGTTRRALHNKMNVWLNLCAKRVYINIYRTLKCFIKINTQKPSSFIYFNLIWVSLSHTFTELYSYSLFLFLPFPQTNAVNDTHKFYWAYQLEAYITATFNVCISFFIHSTWQWSCCKTLFIKIAHIRNVYIRLQLTNFIDIDS